MTSVISILLFFAYSWGFGFTATSFLKRQESSAERHLMNVGIGIGCWIVFGLLLNVLRIPLYWWIFLLASLAYPLIYFIIRYEQIIENIKNQKPALTKYGLSVIMVIIIF